MYIAPVVSEWTRKCCSERPGWTGCTLENWSCEM